MKVGFVPCSRLGYNNEMLFPQNLFKRRLLFCLFLLSTSAWSLTINRVNGGGSVNYVDFSLPGTSIPLELLRTYNSITALNEANGWSGAFGWGWTSPFETTLTTTPERHVILRDGATGNTILFKPQKEDPKVREAFFENVKRAYFEGQRKRKLSDAELSKLKLPDKILSRLKTDISFRGELASRYQLTGTVPRGEMLVSSEYGFQTIGFRNNQWIREKDGNTQIFDKEGRLVRHVDKNGFAFDFRYSASKKNQLVEFSDQDRANSLKVTWAQDRIVEILSNRGQKAKYTYDNNGNLTQVIDSNRQVYGYKYENKKFPHLLTRIDYISESTDNKKIFREMRYDENGLVIYHHEKDGAENNYSYGRSSQDPENNFWTKLVRKDRGSSEEEYDEFFIKARPDGPKYLYKQITKRSGNEVTTIYTACCGKPAQIIKGSEVTNFKYNEFGQLLEKVSPKDFVKLEYDPRWKKVSKVNQNGFTSNYEYDVRGNLVKASNTRNEKVTLKYDRQGRIVEMVDPEGKKISFKYGGQSKPILIAEKGTGTIRISYDNDGRITRTETLIQNSKNRKPSESESQEVIRRVMKSFQTLLNIIRPAGASLTG
jgi:YD repeat-containing protein